VHLTVPAINAHRVAATARMTSTTRNWWRNCWGHRTDGCWANMSTQSMPDWAGHSGAKMFSCARPTFVMTAEKGGGWNASGATT